MWKRRLAIATVLFTVLFFVLIQTAGFQQWLLRRVQGIAARANFPFKADKLRLNIFQLRAALDGFVYDKDGTKVRIDHALIDVPWNGLFGDSIVINKVFADGVTVNIQSGEPVIPEPSGKQEEMPKLQIGELNVHNVNVTYTNQNMLVRIPSFNIDAVNGRGTVNIASPITISPDTQIALQQIPIVIGTDSAQYGPLQWSMQYSGYNGSGAADGDVKWSPSVAFHLNFSTQPMTIEQWKDIQASGKAGYEEGKLKLNDVRIVQNNGNETGQLIANAEISDQDKTAAVMWSGLRIDPTGVPGKTDGTANIGWKASDFSDVNGVASVDVTTRQYGKAHGDIHLVNGKANVDLKANAMDAAIRANVITSMDRTLAGTFNVTQRKYGLVNVNGKVGGTFDNPFVDASLTVRNATYEGIGPLDASAKAGLRGKLLTVSELRAQLKNSNIPDGSLRINLANRQIQGGIPQINIDAHDFTPDVQGKATLAATVAGTMDKPTAEFSGGSDGIDVGGTHIDSARVAGRFANNTLVVNQVEARQGEGGLTAAGSLNVTTKAIAADAHVTNLQINQVSDLSTTANLDATIGGTMVSPTTDFKGSLQNVVYQGQEHGNITLQGTTVNQLATLHAASDKYNAAADARVEMQKPFAFDAKLATKQSRIQYKQYDISINGAAAVTGQAQPFKAGGLTFDDLTIKGNGINLTANGDLNSGAQVKASADLAQLPLDSVTLAGSANVDATVRGDVLNPTIDGSLTTTNATVKTPQMTEPVAIKTAVDFNRNEFSIRDMRAEISDAVVQVTGRGTLKGTGEIQFDATNVHPQNFIKDRPVAGTIGVSGRVNVAAPNVQSITGEATVTQLDLSVRDLPIRQVQPIQVAIENQLFSVRSFELEGAETKATVTGSANLGTHALNFDVNGNTNLGFIEAFLPGSAAEGRLETRLAIRGTTDQPNLNGFLNVVDTQLQTVNPPLILSNVAAEVRFNGDRFDITRGSGKLNDGQFGLSGGAGLSASGVQNAAIHLTLDKAQLEYPEGLQSQLSSDLWVVGTMSDMAAEGTVNIDNAIYAKDIDLTQEIFKRITAEHGEAAIGAPGKPPAVAEQLHLDVQVRTAGPVSIANNMASMDLTGAFRVRGTGANPIILGRASVEEGGELYFGPGVATESSVPGERRDRYVIERGVIDFNNTLTTEPQFDFQATHEINARTEGRVLVTLLATGTPSKLHTEFTSDPPFDEQDIKSMLLTGRTFTELQGSVVAVGEEKLASYFSGRVSGLFETAGSALGLDTVRIEPVALAGEEDLGARLTLGKDLTKDFGLIYSQSLAGGSGQTWIVHYNTIKNLQLRAVNETQNKEYRFELNHDLRIGGGPSLPKRIAPRHESVYGDVTFLTKLNTDRLKKEVGKPGKPFNMSRLTDDVKDLKKLLAKDNMLRARVRAQRNPHDNKVDVQFTIEEGPKIMLAYQGTKVPGKVQDDIRTIWLNSLTDGTALQASDRRLLRYLRDDGFLQAKVTHSETLSNGTEHHYVFDVEPGTKFKDPDWIFKGVEKVDVPDKAGVVMENPDAIRGKIQFELQSKGFLDATSTVPELIFQEDGPKFVVNVEQGKQYMVNQIDFDGLSFMDATRLTRVVRQGPTNLARVEEAGRPPEVEKELPLFPLTNDWVETAQQRVTAEYWGEGFNDVVVNAKTSTDRDKAQVAVHFSIEEGHRQMIEAIRIDGADLTDLSHVQRYLQIKEGDPVDYTRINLTRKKLYDTSLFKRVEIEIVPGQSADSYIAQIHLNESAPWRVRYGFAVGRGTDTASNDLGVRTDLSYTNLFGKGITSGIALKDTRGLKDARIYGMVPVFLNREIKTTLSLFATRDLRLKDTADNTKGITIQQQRRLKNYYILTYDYTYRWEHTFDRNANDDKDIPNLLQKISRLNATLSRDTRDDILNATRGSFLSNSFDLAPPFFGSNIRFVRNYTQYFHFKTLSRNRVWANAVRIGAAKAFSNGTLVPSEQFLAGGGTTLRAFKQDQLTLNAGNALLVLNTELRFPVAGRFGGVAFFDAGNVYERIGTANVLHLRYSPGVGLRVKTPLVLLRLDLGLNLWPRTGEERRRWAFGVGQAF